jgi:hypothetical protein
MTDTALSYLTGAETGGDSGVTVFLGLSVPA